MSGGPAARHLVIFARAPRLGRVKTRLARGLGPLAALRFHRLTTGAVLRRLATDRRWTLWLAVTPDPKAGEGAKGLWPLPRGARLLGQGPGDLGQRMGRVFRGLPPGPAVIVGSDIPEIARDDIAAAFASLRRGADAVLGPSEDGGYWLIGMRRGVAHGGLRLDPFARVAWGGGGALAQTRDNLEAEGAKVALLRRLADIDTAEEWRRWKGR